jgi:hypothetical protein
MRKTQYKEEYIIFVLHRHSIHIHALVMTAVKSSNTKSHSSHHAVNFFLLSLG